MRHFRLGSRFRRNPALLPLVFLLSLLAALMAWLAWPISSSPSGLHRPANTLDSSELLELQRLSEASWERLVAAERSGLPREQLSELARESLDFHEALVEAAPDSLARERWQSLRTIVADADAVEILAAADRLEQEALALSEQGDSAAAIQRYEDALRLLRGVAGKPVSPANRPGARQTRMEMALDNLRAQPLFERSRLLEAEGETLEAAGDHAAAMAIYRQALRLQREINSTFSRTRYADRTRAERLETALASLAAAEPARAISTLVEEAGRLASLEEWSSAAAAYTEAISKQRELNREFPRSRFASLENLRLWETERQTVLSQPSALEIRRLAGSLALAQISRDWIRAGELLVQLEPLLSRMQTEFPNSTALAEEDRERLSFLISRRDRLSGWDEQLSPFWRQVPGHSGVRILAHEVPQSLYREVTGRNPSRQTGDFFPVESLTWMEAGEFCRFLGWSLGRTIRLPSIAEFEAVWNHLQDFPAPASPANQLQPVFPERTPEDGFFHVIGNVAEWVLAGERAPVAGQLPVMGGSYLDPADSGGPVPLQWTGAGERSRAIGFRMVLEDSLP